MMRSSSYSVLVADDDAGCREAVRALLEREGFRTESAESGAHALRMFERDLFHLVILDQSMPELTGIETLRRLAEIDGRVPSILMSGEVDEHTKSEALNAGAFTFISKPIQSAILRHAVQQVIDRYYPKLDRRP